MPGEIDFRAIFIANIIGLTILASVAGGYKWYGKDKSRENRIMTIMFAMCFAANIMSPLSFIADGKAGALNTVLAWASNTWLYATNIIIALGWHALLTTHLGLRLARVHKALLAIPAAALGALLIINLFVPIVFRIENNVYHRTDMYWVYLAAELAVMLDALLIYRRVRRFSGKLKFFPAAAFIVPALMGVAIQTACYGVSAIYPFFAVSFSCIATALQNEQFFRDRLTGLYNRFYLNTLETKLFKDGNAQYTAMMLDINGFKSINDSYGHKIGDKALTEAAQLLQDSIREKGTAIRYAGDEFILILFNIDADETIKAINAAVEEFNRTSGNPYRLSLSYGYCRVCDGEQSIDELVDKIDRLMYENKREYYSKNQRYDRRR